jgi:hypothetical protein
MKYVLAVGLVVGVGMTSLGIGMQLATAEPAPPTVTVQPGEPAKIYGCQTEDSCKIDYANEVWTISPDTP